MTRSIAASAIAVSIIVAGLPLAANGVAARVTLRSAPRSAPAVVLSETGRASSAQPSAVQAQDPQLVELLARAGSYLAGYLPLFSAVTAEEDYRQHFARRPTLSASIGRPYATGGRQLRSDFVLVRMPTAWMTFRDVSDVDGKAVRTPENRLEKVFLANWVIAVVRAAEINDMCGQFDIGDVNRALNHPVMALQFLDLSNQSRFEFKLHGDDVIDGVRASRIDYRETSTPTFIAPDRADTFAAGTVWLEPTTGRVVKTLLKLTSPRERRWLTLQATVVYRPVEDLAMWLPGEMEERWESEVGVTTTVASYANYRRFKAPAIDK